MQVWSIDFFPSLLEHFWVVVKRSTALFCPWIMVFLRQ